MSKYVKQLLQAELEKKFDGISDFLVVETKGINGNDNNLMRGVLKEKGIKLTVVKNAMMSRAISNLGIEAAGKLFISGPSTMAYGGDSVVDVAKEIEAWARKLDTLGFKGAFIDGEVLDSEEAKALAKMPNRVELQAMIVMLAQSPGRNVAGAVAAPGAVIAGCIESLIEKLEEAA